jgi:hypothetical protein
MGTIRHAFLRRLESAALDLRRRFGSASSGAIRGERCPAILLAATRIEDAQPVLGFPERASRSVYECECVECVRRRLRTPRACMRIGNKKSTINTSTYS